MANRDGKFAVGHTVDHRDGVAALVHHIDLVGCRIQRDGLGIGREGVEHRGEVTCLRGRSGALKYADVVAGQVGDVNQVSDGIDGDGYRTRGVGIGNDVGAQVAAIDHHNAKGAGEVGEVGYRIDGDRGEAVDGSAVGGAIAGNG